MTKTLQILILLLTFSSCESQSYKRPKKFKPPETEDLVKLSQESGIELFAIKLLAKHSDTLPKHLRTHMGGIILIDDPAFDPMEQMFDENRPNGKTVLIPGVYINLREDQNAIDIIHEIRPKIQRKLYEIMIAEKNFGFKPDKLAIIKSENKFDPIKYQRTSGINYGIENDSVISILKYFDKKLKLEYVGADNDWCEFEITEDSVDWELLAKECYKFCPDIVEQGTDTVEKLKEEMEKSKRLYFWWD